MPMTKKCYKCGTEMGIKEKVCPSCGAKVSNAKGCATAFAGFVAFIVFCSTIATCASNSGNTSAKTTLPTASQSTVATSSVPESKPESLAQSSAVESSKSESKEVSSADVSSKAEPKATASSKAEPRQESKSESKAASSKAESKTEPNSGQTTSLSDTSSEQEYTVLHGDGVKGTIQPRIVGENNEDNKEYRFIVDIRSDPELLHTLDCEEADNIPNFKFTAMQCYAKSDEEALKLIEKEGYVFCPHCKNNINPYGMADTASEITSENISSTPQIQTYYFILNESTKCFHWGADCSAALKISDEHRGLLAYDAYSLQEAIEKGKADGYKPCGICTK